MERNYIKLKFDAELTPYQILLISKLYIYAHEYHVTTQSLENLYKEYGLPKMVNISFENIIDAAKCGKSLKIQDSTGKYPSITMETLDTVLSSFILNQCNRGLDMAVCRLKDFLEKGNLSSDGIEVVRNLQGQLYSYHTWLPIFLKKIFERNGGEISYEEYCSFIPVLDFHYRGKSMADFYIALFMDYEDGLDTHCDAQDSLVATFTMFEQFKGYCAFCCLIAILFDVSFSAKDYKVFIEVAFFLLYKFKGSILYKIEMTTAPVADKPANLRDCRDHTTRIKFFLFDGQGTPQCIRVDLPHKGEPQLHFNVRSLKGESTYNHKPIPNDYADNPNVFNVLQGQISFECGNLIRFEDTTKEDDQKTLEDMRLFSVLNDLSIDFFYKSDDATAHLKTFSDNMNKRYSDIKDALYDGYSYFVNKL